MALILRREALNGIDPTLDAIIQALNLATLDASIKALDLAWDTCSIPAVRILSGSTGTLLIKARVHVSPLRGDRLVILIIHVV